MTLDAERGLRINKKTVKLKGSCVHHDCGILGAASYEEAHIRPNDSFERSRIQCGQNVTSSYRRCHAACMRQGWNVCDG